MRRFIAFTVFAFLGSCSSSNSSVNLDNEKEVHKALVGSWESTFLETQATRSEVPKEMASIITFKADGNAEGKRKGGEMVSKTKWRYDPKMHYILQTHQQGTYETTIVRISDEELVLTGYTKSDGQIIDSSISTFRKL